MFLTFEGPEGSGKSTQIKKLAGYLEDQGVDLVLTREPGGTEIGDQIRKILLDSANQGMVSDCEQYLYWAARAQHLQEKIWPALEQGKWVLCDRFVESTIAYQGYGRGLDMQQILQLKEWVTKGRGPDLTILLDLPVELGIERATARQAKLNGAEKEDRFEREEITFHQKVRGGFLEMAQNEKDRFVVIDAYEDIDTIHDQVVAAVEAKWKN